jgi:hypothetical protein
MLLLFLLWIVLTFYFLERIIIIHLAHQTIVDSPFIIQVVSPGRHTQCFDIMVYNDDELSFLDAEEAENVDASTKGDEYSTKLLSSLL